MSIASYLSGGNNSQRDNGRVFNDGHNQIHDEIYGRPIEKHNLVLQSVRFVETGTYHDEFLRSYVASSTREAINEISDICESANGGAINPSSLTGAAGKLLSYNPQVNQNHMIDIVNGMQNKRFNFQIEVIEPENCYGGDEIVTTITGYTDVLDVSDGKYSGYTRENGNGNGHISPDTVMYVTQLTRYKRATRKIQANLQLIVPKNTSINTRYDAQGSYVIRPTDVMRAGNAENRRGTINAHHHYNGVGRVTNMSVKTSKIENTDSTRYLSGMINALHHASLDSANSSPYGGINADQPPHINLHGACGYLEEETVWKPNSFMQLIREDTSWNQLQSFTYGELMELFGAGELDDITGIFLQDVHDPRFSDHTRGDTSRWDNPMNGGLNAIIATTLKQTIPGYAVLYNINVCTVDATNMMPTDRGYGNGYDDTIDITVRDVLFSNPHITVREQHDCIELFKNSVRRILSNLSYKNEYDFDVNIVLDWRNDSFYSVGVHGGEMICFSTSAFAAPLTSPIIVPDQSTVTAVSHDIQEITRNILRSY